MIRARLIPCLLVHRKGLVKTVRFADPKYVGDPINAVRIFNEKEVDELVVLDIDATAEGAEPDYAMIRDLAAECRMPLCYGGGVRSVEQAARIVKLGVEKVAVSAAAIYSPSLIEEASRHLGSQSVVAVLDVRRDPRSGAPSVWTHNATRSTGLDPVAVASDLERRGVGELVVNSIDRDGTMAGYDLELARAVRAVTSVPLTILGGAASLADIEAAVREFGIIGVAAGSLFVFKGAFRAVLINYPDRARKFAITTAGRAGT